MDKLEKVELIREKTGVSYDDAKVALEASNDDVLDAIIWLERMGKAQAQTAAYTTSSDPAGNVSAEMAQAQVAYQEQTKRTKFGEWLRRVGNEVRRLLRASLDTQFVIRRHGERVIAFPVLVLVLGIVFWWAALPLLILGLFFDCHYHFEGVRPITVDVNDMMDKVASGADSLKDAVMGDKDDAQA